MKLKTTDYGTLPLEKFEARSLRLTAQRAYTTSESTLWRRRAARLNEEALHALNHIITSPNPTEGPQS